MTRNDYSDAEMERGVDQIVVEHGTLPVEELFYDFSPKARDESELDIEALIAGRPQEININKDAEFVLFRVGDAVASRNIHAIYDPLRLRKEF